MDKYIEREAALDGLDGIDWYHINDNGRLVSGGTSGMDTYVPFKAVEEMLRSIPAADVVEVRHGRWEERIVDDPFDPYGFFKRRWYCSSCGRYQTYGTTAFCPRCGARMDGGADDGKAD